MENESNKNGQLGSLSPSTPPPPTDRPDCYRLRETESRTLIAIEKIEKPGKPELKSVISGSRVATLYITDV